MREKKGKSEMKTVMGRETDEEQRKYKYEERGDKRGAGRRRERKH